MKFSILIRFFTTTLICLILSIVMGSCNAPAAPTNTITHHIKDREHRPLYRIKYDPTWIVRDPLQDEDLSDTTKALCEFIIPDAEGVIRINFHSFPSEAIDQRIPPTAQVARWQRQFEELSPHDSYTLPQSFSGYAGLLFCGAGTMQGKPMKMMAWSLQLGPTHYRSLLYPSSHQENQLYRQMRADITIKAIGPTALVEKHADAILAFARTFELIEEIPERS